DRFDQLLARCRGGCLKLGWNVTGFEIWPAEGPHCHQVDDAVELILSANRQLNRHDLLSKAFAKLIDGSTKIGVLAVHLADDHDPRLAASRRLLPSALGTDLDARYCLEKEDDPIHNP